MFRTEAKNKPLQFNTPTHIGVLLFWNVCRSAPGLTAVFVIKFHVNSYFVFVKDSEDKRSKLGWVTTRKKLSVDLDETLQQKPLC